MPKTLRLYRLQMKFFQASFPRHYTGCNLSILFSLITVLFFLSGCGKYLQKDVSPKLPDTSTANQELQADPDLISGTLENGFRYILLKNNEPKERVSIHLNAQVGSLHEEDQEQGIAHYLEHMMYNSLTHFEKGELIKYFQSIGMQFGADANAHTGFDETVYDMLLPDGSEKHLQDSLKVMDDIARGALLLPEEIDKERKIILAEKRARDSASYRTFVSTLNFSLPETRLTQRLPIGIDETINNADQKILKDFYDTWYRPENLVLVAVGDFDPNVMKTLIEETFSSLSPRAPPKETPGFGEIHHKGIKPFYHHEEEEGATSVTIETVKKVPFQKDSYDFQKKLFTLRLANQMVQNRLNRMLSESKAPFTEANIGSGIYLHHIEFNELSASCAPEKWEETLATLEKTLRTCVTYGFLPSEFERVKKDMLTLLENEVKGKPTRDSRKIASQIIMSLNEDRVFQSPEQEKALYSGMLDTLTLEEVHRAFKKHWPEAPRLLLVTGNADLPSSDTSPEDRILSIYKNSMAVSITKPIAADALDFPYLPAPETPGYITRRENISDLGMTIVDFKNGVRLNMKKTDFKADEILFCLSFGYGRSNEPEDKPGLSILAQATLNESGYGKLNKDELQRALSGKSTSYIFSITDEHFAFSGSSVSNETELIFQLLYAQITDLTLRESALKLAQNRFKQQYETLERSIEGAVMLYGESFLAGGDSRFGLPPYDTFKQYTLSDVTDWIVPAIKQDRLEISIVGDFDPEQVIQAAATYLGSLPERADRPLSRDISPLNFPAGKDLNVDVKTEVPKGLVIITYLTDEFWHIERTRRLSAMGAIFSERMRLKIREKLGAAYSPFSYNQSSQTYPNYGLFKAIVPGDPEQTEMVIDAVKEISEDISQNGITEEELRLAVDPIITTIKDMQRTNSYWLNNVFVNSVKHPEQLNWARTIKEDYQSISVRDIDNMAKFYLKNEKAAIIRIHPK